MKELLDKLEKLFLTRLEEKNSWGKNEVKRLYQDCQIEVLREAIKDLI